MATSGSCRAIERRFKHLGMPDQGADPDRVAAILDAAQHIDPVDVDEHVRRRQPHIERRHQALAAGQDLRVAGAIAKQRQRLVDVVRSPIEKRGGFHRGEP